MRRIGLGVVLATNLALTPLPGGAQQVVGLLAEAEYVAGHSRKSPPSSVAVPGQRPCTDSDRLSLGRTFAVPGAVPDAVHPFDAFLRELHKLGYVSGKKPIIETRIANATRELETAARDLAQRNVDLIVTFGTPPTIAARSATTIPIVMIGVAEPVEMGFAESLARPGGQVTGISFLGPELLAKGLELLKEAAPKATNLGVLFNPANPAARRLLAGMEQNAKPLRVHVQPLMTQHWEEVKLVFRRYPLLHGLVVINDPLFLNRSEELVRLISAKRLPAIFQLPSYVTIGGLMAYGPDIPEMYTRAAALAHKILLGAKPADLPIEQPTKFDLVINMTTAKALCLTIPKSLLVRADRVIE